MSEQVTATAESFDVSKHLRDGNEAESARRAGRPMPGEPEPKEEPKPDATHEAPMWTRAQRREMNRLREELGEARGRSKALEEMLLANGKSSQANANKEPERSEFKTDAEYTLALAKWAVKNESAAVNGEKSAMDTLTTQIAEAKEAWADQRKYIEKWDEIAEDAMDLKTEQESALLMFATSEFTPMITEYFVKNEEEWNKFLALGQDVVAQRRYFHRLEGRMEILYNERQHKAKPEEKKKPTAAELDAAKAKPSETVTTRGVHATNGTVSMLLADGKTLNPAWKAEQNARAGLRP